MVVRRKENFENNFGVFQSSNQSVIKTITGIGPLKKGKCAAFWNKDKMMRFQLEMSHKNLRAQKDIQLLFVMDKIMRSKMGRAKGRVEEH